MNYLHVIPFAVLAVAVIIALLMPVKRGIAVAVALIPWFGLTPDIGVAMALSKYVVVIIIFKYFLFESSKHHAFPGQSVLLFIVCLSLFSAAYTLANIDTNTDFAGGDLRNGWMRVLVVLISLSTSVAPIFLINGASDRDLIFLLRVYLASVLIECVIGIVQHLIHLATGVDIIPIGLLAYSGDELRSGILEIGGSSFLRPSAFAGEPKSLGMAAATGCLLLLGLGKEIYQRSRTRFLAIVVMLITIYLTQSTSALVCIFLGFIVNYVIKMIGAPFTSAQVSFLYAFFSVVMLLLFFDTVSIGSVDQVDAEFYQYDGSFFDTLYRRTFSRLGIEDTDWVILRSMLEEPLTWIIGRGLGLGHLSTAEFIPAVWSYYLEGKIIFPKTGVTYFFVAGGILGVMMGSIFLSKLTPSPNKKRMCERAQGLLIIYQRAAIPLALLFLLRIYAFDSVLFLMSALIFLYKQRAHDLSQKMGDDRRVESRSNYVIAPLAK